LTSFFARIDINENPHERVSNKAITDVSSSMIIVSVRFAIRRDVITTRQKPRRVADVFNICGDVLFAIP